MTRTLSPVATLLLLTVNPARAQQGDETEPVGSDEFEVVVVGKRVQEPPFLSDRSISVLKKQALVERAARTTPEALWEAPGVFVQQTNHGGGSPILRGMIGPQNLILVDGVRLNNSVYRTGPLQYLNLLDPLALQRIEVLRGPGSVLYGSDAMGGVIQVSPLAPADYRARKTLGASAAAHAGYASANQGVDLHGHMDVGGGPVSLLGGGTFRGLDDLTAGREVGTQIHSGYDHWATIGAATYHIHEGSRLGLRLTAAHLFSKVLDAGRTDKLYDARSLQIYDNDDHLAYGRLHLRYTPLRTSGDLTLSFQHFFERKDNHTVYDDYRTPEKTTRDETTVDTGGADLQLVTRLLGGRARVQYGGMWYRDWVQAARFKREQWSVWQQAAEASYPDGSTYDNYGGFLMAEGDAIRTASGQIVRLGAGYRLHGMRGSAPATGSLPEVEISGTGHVFTGSIQYLHGQRINAALTFSQGFRAPNLNEAVMLGDTGKFFHVPNDDLEPERIDTLELLLRGRVWRLTASWAGYVSFLHDIIKREQITDQEALDRWAADAGGKEIWWNVNGGDGLLWGTEAQLSIDVGRGLSFAGSVTYTWGKEHVAGGPDVPLSRIPPLFGVATARYDAQLARRWRGFVEAYVLFALEQDRLSVEDEKDVRIPEGGTPGWWTANLRLGVTRSRVRFGLTFENLGNETYKYHGSGIYGAGTNARIFAEASL
jgi:outer membrane receptor protein involved in Fe transport